MLLLALGCAAPTGEDVGNDASPAAGGSDGAGAEASGGSATAGGGGGGAIENSAGSLSLAVGGSSTSSAPETCDGVDNDTNGIVDDVDVGNDGVCDCLNIATVGQIGPWGDGTGIFASWLSTRSPLGAVSLGNQVLTEELLRPYQVVVMLHTQTEAVSSGTGVAEAYHAFSEQEATTLTAWVNAGGGLMTTIGYNYFGTLEETNINKVLSGMGAGYLSNGAISGYVTNWMPHPVTDGVTNIFIQNGVAADQRGTALGFGPYGEVALQVVEHGTGRVVEWGDEWITYDSQWQDVQDQQVERLWLNILKWLSPSKNCQVPIPK